jgi:mycofactocin precursor
MTQQATMEVTTAPEREELAQVTPAAEEKRAAEEALIADELLVEEVSIDGMCGVY